MVNDRVLFRSKNRQKTKDGKIIYKVPLGRGNRTVNGKFYSSDLLRRVCHNWNNKPVVLDHPHKFVTDSETLDQYKLGSVFNAKFDGTVLWADVEIDPLPDESDNRFEWLKAVHDELEKSDTAAFSTAYLTECANLNGKDSFGKPYDKYVVDAPVDHLALCYNTTPKDPENVGAKVSWFDRIFNTSKTTEEALCSELKANNISSEVISVDESKGTFKAKVGDKVGVFRYKDRKVDFDEPAILQDNVQDEEDFQLDKQELIEVMKSAVSTGVASGVAEALKQQNQTVVEKVTNSEPIHKPLSRYEQVLESLAQEYEQKKINTVTEITQNSELTKEDLNGMSQTGLDKLKAELVKKNSVQPAVDTSKAEKVTEEAPKEEVKKEDESDYFGGVKPSAENGTLDAPDLDLFSDKKEG